MYLSLPIDLVIVRHGQSEGNLANKHDYDGDSSLKTPEHLNRHNSTWRLTDLGIHQAKMAGAWIRDNIPGKFDFHLVSPYVRARETAAYLDLPDAAWEIDPYLVEMDYGDLDSTTKEVRETRYAESLSRRALNEFYWRAPGGENRIASGIRWDRVMTSLCQRHSDQRVIIVAHQSIIEAAYIRRLHWTVEEFCRWHEVDDPATKIHNCQVTQFSRRNPETGQVGQSIRWWRTVCPWQMEVTHGNWQEIVKRYHSNEELLAGAQEYPRYISG